MDNLQDKYLELVKEKYLQDKKVTTAIKKRTPRTVFLESAMRNIYIHKESLEKQAKKPTPIFMNKSEINKRIKWFKQQSFNKEHFSEIIQSTLMVSYKHHDELRALHLLIERNRVPNYEMHLDENEVNQLAIEFGGRVKGRVPTEKLSYHMRVSERFYLGSNKKLMKKKAQNFLSGKGNTTNTFNPELNYAQLKRTVGKYLAEMTKFLNFIDDFSRLTKDRSYRSMVSALLHSLRPIVEVGISTLKTSEKDSHPYIDAFIYLLHLLFQSEGLSVNEADIKVAETIALFNLPSKSESTIYRIRTKGEKFIQLSNNPKLKKLEKKISKTAK
jgi:hypothetical protein